MSRRLVPLAMLLLPLPALGAERHPADATKAGEACEACHARETPEVVKQWEAGPHGLVLVKCFVCHGSTGKDFRARGTAASCDGCHPAEAARVVPAKAARRHPLATRCFSCHDPHSLAVPEGKATPHAAP
jgi:hypothetical protein